LPDRACTDSIRRRVASPRVAREEELAKKHRDRRFRADERRALARTNECRLNRDRIAIESDNGQPCVSIL